MVISLPGEIWKDVPDYEGLYMASNLGRFKALDKTYYTGENLLANRFKKEHLLKLYPTRDGYLRLDFSKDGVALKKLGHIVIANIFVPNQYNKPEVNHKDGVKANIAAYNLEWATHSENIKHAFDTGLKTNKKLGESHAAKKVFNTITKEYYGSIKEAAVAINISYHNLQNRLLGIVENKTGLIYV
jgi:hypothetical protein